MAGSFLRCCDDDNARNYRRIECSRVYAPALGVACVIQAAGVGSAAVALHKIGANRRRATVNSRQRNMGNRKTHKVFPKQLISPVVVTPPTADSKQSIVQARRTDSLRASVGREV